LNYLHLIQNGSNTQPEKQSNPIIPMLSQADGIIASLGKLNKFEESGTGVDLILQGAWFYVLQFLDAFSEKYVGNNNPLGKLNIGEKKKKAV
jgi:hypothetical protein